jgi:hypothetical protein
VLTVVAQRQPQPAPNCGLSESEGRSLASELVGVLGDVFIAPQKIRAWPLFHSFPLEALQLGAKGKTGPHCPTIAPPLPHHPITSCHIGIILVREGSKLH